MQIKVNIQLVPIDNIFPNIWNPNKQSDFIFERELTSIQTHGFLDPILVREISDGFEIIDGEHRFRAGTQLGYKELPCNNLGIVSDSVAKQLTVLMNEVKGKADTGKLSDIMKDLHQELGMEALEIMMPYTKVEMDALIHVAEIDWNALSPEKKDGEGEGMGFGNEPGDWKTLCYRLPTDVSEAFQEQVNRVKLRIHPDKKPKDASPVQAMEAITQHLAQMSDEELF